MSFSGQYEVVYKKDRNRQHQQAKNLHNKDVNDEVSDQEYLKRNYQHHKAKQKVEHSPKQAYNRTDKEKCSARESSVKNRKRWQKKDKRSLNNSKLGIFSDNCTQNHIGSKEASTSFRDQRNNKKNAIFSSQDSFDPCSTMKAHQQRKDQHSKCYPGNSRQKVNNEQEFHHIMTQRNIRDKNADFSRRSRKLRANKAKREYGKDSNKRHDILFETFDETSRISSEIQNSLVIIQQAKAQNEKYSVNRSIERVPGSQVRNNLTQVSKKESYTQKYKHNLRKEGMKDTEYRATMPETFSCKPENFSQTQKLRNDAQKTNSGNTTLERQSSTGMLENMVSGRISNRNHFNRDMSVIKEGAQNRSHSQIGGVKKKTFRHQNMQIPKASNKMISASPASNFMSSRDKPQTHKKYVQKPVHKVLNNLMEEEEDEEIIMKMLNDRKKELFNVKRVKQDRMELQRDSFEGRFVKQYHRDKQRFHDVNKSRKRLKSPAAEKLSKDKIKRIRQQSSVAERKYREKLDAVKLIQKCWRKHRHGTIKQLENKAEKVLQEDVANDLENLDSYDDVIVEADSIQIPIVKHDAPGRHFDSAFETRKRVAPEISSYAKEKLLALFKGWKTRRILRNQHLKELKVEIGYMLKLKKNDLNERELKHCRAEFSRIANKFCTIFLRLSANKEWIKKYNINFKRNNSVTRNRSESAQHSNQSNFRPVFDISQNNQSKQQTEMSSLPSKIQDNKLSTKKSRNPENENNQNGAKTVKSTILQQNKEEVSNPVYANDDTQINKDRTNMFEDIGKQKMSQRNRDYSTPSIRLNNNLAKANIIDNYRHAPISPRNNFDNQNQLFQPEVRNKMEKSPSMQLNYPQMSPAPVAYNPQIYPGYQNFSQAQANYNQPQLNIHQPSMGVPQQQMGVPQAHLGVHQPQFNMPQTHMGPIPNQIGIAQNQIGMHPQIMQPVYQYQGAHNPIYIIYQGQPVIRDEINVSNEPFSRPLVSNSHEEPVLYRPSPQPESVHSQNLSQPPPKPLKSPNNFSADESFQRPAHVPTEKYHTAKQEPKLSKKEELSFMDTFPSQKNPEAEISPKNYLDDRPIKPQKPASFGKPTSLATIPEKRKNKSSNQKTYLKKKKVYDPKESIKKEMEYKKKVKEERKKFLTGTKSASACQKVSTVNKPSIHRIAPAFDGSKALNKPPVRNNQPPANSFANMNKEQRVQKISQLLRGKRS
ncbi:unnamed protein product [Moneuplotes crassus]|uniref:Uncharacterized protein n=1 Tax=Euplotes crassus TaxID=5936 RepID=A0AAD1XAQ3_EUPCR|nr:unnamed protein product [Moneuplotes crassus]